MSTRIIGIVTDETGIFICKKCQQDVQMVAVIDQRDVRRKVWLEAELHPCVRPFKKVEVLVYPNPGAKQ